MPPVFLRLNPSLHLNEPLIIAHRGASALAPENTLAAFARALKDDADGLELDVHLARDGVPVVIHDSNLGRTGPSMRNVAEVTSKQLSQVDVGSWFNQAKPALAREEYSFQHVPTFAEVIQLVKTIPTSRPCAIYVEMKTMRDSSFTRDLAQAVIQLVKDHDLCKQVIFISFDLKAVALAKQIEAGRASATVHIGSTPFLGVSVATDADQSVAGAVVAGVVSGSPADQAGIVTGDTITAVDGQSIASYDALAAQMLTHNAGATVSLTWVDQAGATHTADVQTVAGPPQ